MLFCLSLYYTKQQTSKPNGLQYEDHPGSRFRIPDREHPNTPRPRRLVWRKRKAEVIHCNPALGERALESYSNT